MNPSIITLIEFEEGWSATPYPCSNNYPTVGFGFKLGPKLANKADIRLYQFNLPRAVGELWLTTLVDSIYQEMLKHAVLGPLIKSMQLTGVPDYQNARICVLISMAYQMGIIGLGGFVNTLKFMQAGDWYSASHSMMQSKWVAQTPSRAQRHAEQIRTGQWQQEYR